MWLVKISILHGLYLICLLYTTYRPDGEQSEQPGAAVDAEHREGQERLRRSHQETPELHWPGQFGLNLPVTVILYVLSYLWSSITGPQVKQIKSNGHRSCCTEKLNATFWRLDVIEMLLKRSLEINWRPNRSSIYEPLSSVVNYLKHSRPSCGGATKRPVCRSDLYWWVRWISYEMKQSVLRFLVIPFY